MSYDGRETNSKYPLSGDNIKTTNHANGKTNLRKINNKYNIILQKDKKQTMIRLYKILKFKT